MASPFLRTLALDRVPAERVAYPLGLPLFDRPFAIEFRRPVTVITGENGTGKSTLLEAIADHCGFAVAGGSRNHRTDVPSDVTSLTSQLRFSWTQKVPRGFFFRAETLFGFSTYIDQLAQDSGEIAYAAYGGKSLHQQSHGEAFLSVLSGMMRSKGIYLLDEPEAALSPQRQLQLLALMHEAHQSGEVQLVIVTHSPMLLAYPQAEILEIASGMISPVRYQETANYKLYRRFFEAPETLFGRLFRDES